MTDRKLTLTEEQLEDLRKLRERPRKCGILEEYIRLEVNHPDDELTRPDWGKLSIHGQIDEDVTYVQSVCVEENGGISLFIEHRETRIIPLSEATLHPEIIAEIHRRIEKATTSTKAKKVTK